MLRDNLFDLLGESLLLVASDCLLVDATASANALLDHGTVMSLDCGRVVAADAMANLCLQQALKQLLSPNCPASMLAVDLLERNGSTAALAFLSRPPAGVPSRRSKPLAMIHIVVPRAHLPTPTQALRKPFGVTAAAASMARAVQEMAICAEAILGLQGGLSTYSSQYRWSAYSVSSCSAYRFDRFVLDLSSGVLLDKEGDEIPLRPKSMALLRLLVEHGRRTVDRDTIMAVVWPDVVVVDESITQCVRDIRKAIGDGAQQLLRTIPKRGYRLVADVVAMVA